MSDKKEDVLRQLERAVYTIHLPLVAKVAELLAADEEYDDSKADKWDPNLGLKNQIAAEKRFSAAKKRRAAAIRAMRGDV